MRKTNRPDPEMLRALGRLTSVGESAPALEERMTLLRMVRGQDKAFDEIIDDHLLRATHRLHAQLQEMQKAQAKLKKNLDQLASPPYHPAIYLGCETTSRGPAAMVAQGGARRVIPFADGFDPSPLQVGDEVLLSGERTLVMEKSPYPTRRGGDTALFRRWTENGRLVLEHQGEEILVQAAGGLNRDDLKLGDRVRWERDLWIAYERIERDRGQRLFLEETPDETFAGIGGLDEQIAALKRAIRLHIDHPELVAKYGFVRRGGVLLVGPPGTGKTMLSRALANWLAGISPAGRSRFINIRPSQLNSVWYSQAEANFRDAFRIGREAAREQPDVPVVMFFDEIDSLGRTRGQYLSHIDDRVLTAFMAELDGLESRGNILVVGATNRVDTLDPALLRPRRLGDLVLEVPRPNREAARAIFSRYLGEDLPYSVTPPDGDEAAARESVIHSALAKIYSPNGGGELATLQFRDGRRQMVRTRDLVNGANIAKVCTDARERAFIREIETGVSGIQPDDILTAIQNEFARAVRVLTPRNIRTHLTELPQDLDVVSVEPIRRQVSQPRRYFRMTPGVH